MKKLIIYTALIVCTGLMAGCKKYLDKEPDNRTQVKTPEQIAELLTTAYPHANYILFTESMSDNAEDKGGGGSGYDFVDKINSQSYRYQVVEVAPDNEDGPDFYWNACYKAIAAANQALEYIDKASNQDQLKPHRGEALVARAYAHFMLVTLFAKAYDPATAATDPGIPYVTAPEKTTFAKYERKTVAYVYQMIEKDLKEGLPLINDQIYGSAPKFHFNRRAAAAFAARFYLFKQDYASVITYATQALGDTPADRLRPWNTTYQNYQYLELQAQYTRSDEQTNLLLQEANSLWGRSYASLRFGLGSTILNRLISSRNVSGWYYAYPVYGTERAYNIPKFYENFVVETINANSGDPFNTIPLFTAEEALLNRVEAYARTNNITGAINDLNAFISKNIDDYDPSTDNVTAAKMNSFYGTTNTALAAIASALDFKRAYFLHEGMRWFDILRLKIPVTHRTTDGEQYTLAADDKRKILQLPTLTKGAGLEPNQR